MSVSPVLVLLPGMDGTGDLFQPFTAALGNAVSTRIVRYPLDLPLGYSDLIKRVAASLPAEAEYVLLAESFSGPIAIEIAATAPRGLRALILCSSFVRNPRPFLIKLDLLRALVPPAVVLLGTHGTRSQRTALTRALSQVRPEVLQARLRAIQNVDVRAGLAQVKVPILCLKPSQDRVVPQKELAEIVRIQPRARVVELPGPHLILQTASVLAAEVVGSFLQTLSDHSAEGRSQYSPGT